MKARVSAVTAIFAVALLAGCPGNSPGSDVPQRDEVPPTPPEGTAGVSGGGPRVTCEEDLARPSETPPKKTAPAQPRKDLALLLPPKTTGAKPVAKSVRLEKISVRLPECVRPRAEIDVSSLDLPADVPRPDLPADLHPEWDKRTSVKKELEGAQLKGVEIDRARALCEVQRCPKKVCFDDLRVGTNTRVKTLKKDLTELEDTLAKKLAAAAPTGGTSLALGHLLERAAKRGDGDPTAEMKPAIAAYEAAKAKSTADSDIGWFARYRLALAYDDAGQTKQAKAEWIALAAAPPRAKGTSEVHFRAAEHETDPVRAALAFDRALKSMSTDEAKYFRAAFTYRLLRAQTSAGRFADAVATAASLLDLARDDNDAALTTETIEELAFALDSIGDSSNPLPSIPADEWTKVGTAVTREAFSRFDPASAAVAQKALGSSNAGTQPPTEALPRMNAVARSCGYLALGSDGGEIDVRVDAMSEGRAKVTAKKRTGDAQVDAAAACIERRAPAYFVGAPSSASATIAFLSK